MKRTIAIIILQLCALQTMAQTIIEGNITDQNNGAPVALADIALYKKADSSFIKAFQSDDSGNFVLTFPGIPAQFYIKPEAMGYCSQIFALNDSGKVSIRPQPLKVAALSAVTVVTRKKAVSMVGDRIIYDVDQLGIGTANNGLETMQQLPGISLDKDENIKFRGSTGIQIMINGRKSMLLGDAMREFIRSLKGDDIKTVEIIAQPSARYEATGTTGILNIVLKRNTLKKLGGSIYNNSSYGKYFKNQSGGLFFYNDEKWSANASGAYYTGKSFNDRAVNQTVQLENSTRNLNQSNYWLPQTKSYSFNLAAERKINKNQLLSTEWQWYKETEKSQTTGNTLDYLNNTWQNEVHLLKQNKTPSDQVSGNVFYNYTSDSSATKIDAQVNYGYYQKSSNGFQQNTYTTGETDRLDGLNQTDYTMMNAQLDWNQKISPKFQLESGVKFSFVDMHYFNQYDVVQGSNFIIPDSLLTNDFNYKEKMTSAYTQLHYNLEKWNFLAGLRMENYDYHATSKTNSQTNKDNYTNLFPSASVNYESGNHQYRLSYSKRIQRPSYLTLNPYFQYLDAYSIEKGNPNLKPQFYHSFELNYIYKNALSFGLYGYLYKNGFVSVIDYQDTGNYNILYQSNASDGSRFGFSASVPCKVGKWWTMQYSLDAYLESQKSAIPDYTYNGNGYGLELNMYQRFTLPKSWTITCNGFVTGRNKTPTGYNPVIYDFSTSVRKFFMKEKFQLVAGSTNILKKSMWNQYSTVGSVTTHWVNKWETRKFYVQITYRFGGKKEKKVKATSLDEEQGRL